MESSAQLNAIGGRDGPSPPALDPVLRNLRQWAPLSEPDVALLERLRDRSRSYGAGEVLAAEGRPARTQFLLSGWAARQRILGQRGRQILEFLLPGDPFGFEDQPALASVAALTTVWTIERDPVLDGAEVSPALIEALARLREAREKRLLDQIVRLGRLPALPRLADLLLELAERLEVAGVAERTAGSIPLTQDTLAQALGLSVVHINRVLKAMRELGAVEYRMGNLRILNRSALRRIVDGQLL